MFYKILLLGVFILSACSKKETVPLDLIIHNGYVYTVDEKTTVVDAIGVSKGKIVFVGTSSEALQLKNPDTKVIDANGHFVMPGFIEGHGHFSGLGYSLINLNFLKSKSWQEIVDSVSSKALKSKKGEWIEGRGWHQEKWSTPLSSSIQGYPFHDDLSKVTNDNPVILFHASGHSLFANKKAMDLAGISADTKDPEGGRIVRNQNKEAIGVFEERAMDLIKNSFEEYKKSLDANRQEELWLEAIAKAEEECINKGITSFQDAGSKFFELDRYEKLAKDGKLDLRLWVMARHSYEDMKNVIARYKKIGVGNNFYTCNAIKSEVDGALGAFGAWLLKPYADKPDFHGQNTTDIYEVKRIGELAMENNMQYCVHSIGDRANRVVLDVFEGLYSINPTKKDMRWRVEHAQHLDPKDFPRFAKHQFIASMQAVHCTSDAPFVAKRLGEQRAKYGAYAWRTLLDNKVKIANGTDAPVEDVDPIKNFYASVTRKREDNGMVFFPEQKMTRAEAIKSYTYDNAYAAKEEKIKGSIEVGKVADFVILSNNLLKCKEQDILKTKVLFTIINGKIKKKVQ
jgi:predicted amidohydrolase YtcJ